LLNTSQAATRKAGSGPGSRQAAGGDRRFLAAQRKLAASRSIASRTPKKQRAAQPLGKRGRAFQVAAQEHPLIAAKNGSATGR
jgi:hypothetical protein